MKVADGIQGPPKIISHRVQSIFVSCIVNLNRAFTNEIFQVQNAFLMQPETEGSIAEVEAYDTKTRLKSFELYEEYSRREIVSTIEARRFDYEGAGAEKRKELEMKVEEEVESFRAWLEEKKKIEPLTAHYLSVGLKSLLLGLPKGVQVAQLFYAVLDKHGHADNIH